MSSSGGHSSSPWLGPGRRIGVSGAATSCYVRRVRPRALLAVRIAAAVFAFVTVSRFAPVCFAATPEESAAARAHFETGERHYDLREYEEALREFKDAYRIVPDPVLLYNIGQCHWKLQHRREAIDFYRQYVRRLPSAPNAKEVQARVRELEKELEHSPEPPPAATTPPPPPPPAVTTPARTAPPPVAAPAPAATATEPPASVDLTAAAPTEPAPTDAPLYSRWWFWTAIGVVVAGAAVGVALAASGRGDVGDCQGLVPCARIGR